MELNPVLAKELDAGSRRWRTYAVRMAYVLFLVVGVWAGAGAPLTARPFLTVSEYAELGHEIFRAFAVVQFWLVTLYAVLAGADLFAREIRADTLGLLSLTLLSPGALVRGKWLAASAHSASLLVCGLPVLGIAVWLGGAGGFQVLSLTLSTLVSILLAAALAVWTSAGGRSITSSAAAALFGYFIVLVAAAVPSSMAAIVGIDLFPFVHPYGTTLACLIDTTEGGRWGWLVSCPLGLFTAALVLEAARHRLQAPDALAPRQVRTSGDIESREEYAKNAIENLGLQSVHHRVWDRFPLLWKEIRTRAAAHIRYETRLIVGGSLALIVISGLMMEEGDQLKIFHAFVPIALLLAVAGGAGLFSRDLEDRRWEAILGAPVSSRQILAAKLLSGPASPEGATIIVLAILSLAPFRESVLVEAATALGLYLTFAYLLAGLASLVTRSLRTAMALAGAVVAAIPLSLPLSGFGRLGSLNPYSYFLLLTDPPVELYFLVFGTAVVVLAYAILAVFRLVTGRP